MQNCCYPSPPFTTPLAKLASPKLKSERRQSVNIHKVRALKVWVRSQILRNRRGFERLSTRLLRWSNSEEYYKEPSFLLPSLAYSFWAGLPYTICRRWNFWLWGAKGKLLWIQIKNKFPSSSVFCIAPRTKTLSKLSFCPEISYTMQVITKSHSYKYLKH